MSSSLEIVNATEYIISGEISYMTVFCTSHYFFVKPFDNWTPDKRKICPIVEVSAAIRTPRGIFHAESYISMGSHHHVFEVTQTRENIFKVIKKETEKFTISQTVQTQYRDKT